MDPTERLAAAVERLATAVELLLAGQQITVPCDRCEGRGWQGHPDIACRACGGRGGA